MSFNNQNFRGKGTEGCFHDDELYRIVWKEIESGVLDPIAQARAIEEGVGDQGKTRSAYIKHRVRRLRDEIEKNHDQPKKATPENQSNSQKKSNKNCSFCREERGIFDLLMGHSSLCSECFNKISKISQPPK